jgi:23S rRNA (cytosine1962-C5)-methyltransferase
MSAKSPVQWRLRAGADRRFRAGHPWVYSNELAESPKGLEPGGEVELRDAGGKFLARGYGNPASLIAFRALTRDAADEDPLSDEGLLSRLREAWRFRASLGLNVASARLCFGEADRLPGLIVDRYVLADGRLAFVAQAHTAGMDRVSARLPGLLEKLAAEEDRPLAAVVLRNDVGVRKLEGLGEEPPRIERSAKGFHPADARIRASGGEFAVDLVSGQKTGFFLDQAANVRLAADRLAPLASKGTVRILDLFCYAGQWGASLARAFRAAGASSVQVTAVDASAAALELARRNLEAAGASVETVKADILRQLGDLPERAFDVVVCDPPALIKGRKDLPVGARAYLQLNTQALRRVRPGGALVSCSCSALLEEEELVRMLGRAAARAETRVRWIARGGQAPDHPVLAEFPEGRYLKCWIGVTNA